MVHIHNEMLLSHKKEQNNATCSNMDGPRDCHTAWSTADTERQIPYNIAHVWDRKRAQANLFTRQSRVSNVESKHGWQEVRGRGRLGLIYALKYIKLMTNKDLLYTQGTLLNNFRLTWQRFRNWQKSKQLWLPRWRTGKHLPGSAEDPPEEDMAARSSIVAWKIPWTEEPGGPQAMGSQRAGDDWVCTYPWLICCGNNGRSYGWFQQRETIINRNARNWKYCSKEDGHLWLPNQ